MSPPSLLNLPLKKRGAKTKRFLIQCLGRRRLNNIMFRFYPIFVKVAA